MTTRENQNANRKTARHTSKSCENSPKKPDTVKNDIDIPQTLESLKRAISTGFEKTLYYVGIQDRKTRNGPQPAARSHDPDATAAGAKEKDRRSDPGRAKEKDRRSGPCIYLNFFIQSQKPEQNTIRHKSKVYISSPPYKMQFSFRNSLSYSLGTRAKMRTVFPVFRSSWELS